MTDFFNRSPGKDKRRELRSNMPRSEVILWSKLRGKQVLDTKFRRQHGIGPYIVDFYCQEKKLVIEVDGDSHFTPEAKEYDRLRQIYIESLGIRIVRFTNDDVDQNLEGVLEVIATAIAGAEAIE